LGGGDYDAGAPLSSTISHSETEAHKSYYFPPDPEQPNWRPITMHWGYISLLIFLALALAGIQEYLCQKSITLVNEDPKTGGLLKFKKPVDLSMAAYFGWKYSPTLILVTYGVLWQVTDFEVKRLEPFYQLSRKTGATAAESLNMDYLTFLSYLIPLKAVRYKQWAVFLSSSSYLLAGSLVPVLQSASMNVYPPKSQRITGEYKSVRIDPPWSRAVSAFLVIVAINGIILLFQLRRKSGLLSDPKGIAGVAAMATRSHILHDFDGLDTAPHHAIHKQLRHRRYILHKSSLWQGEYIRHTDEEVKKHTDPRPVMLRLVSGIFFIGFIICFAVLIPVFVFVNGANEVTEKLPWLMTAIATIVKLLWGTMDSDVRLLEPFYRLSRRRAPPSTLTLDYTGTIPGYLSIQSFLNKHYLVCLVGLGAIMTEVLTVCASSFSVDGRRFFPGKGGDDPDDNHKFLLRTVGFLSMRDEHEIDPNSRYNSDETFKSFWVSFALVIGILLYLCIIATLVYVRRSQRFIPRQVGTIASVLGFIHQSNMLDNFVDTERMNSNEMTKHLNKLGKTYALGWFRGRDNKDHCGIDEEPMLAPYEWGKDFRDSRLDLGRIGNWEHL
jgi:hypothetical protein